MNANAGGSQTIGTGFLKCESFLNQKEYHSQNFILIFDSKWLLMAFLVKTFAEIRIAKIVRACKKSVEV